MTQWVLDSLREMNEINMLYKPRGRDSMSRFALRVYAGLLGCLLFGLLTSVSAQSAKLPACAAGFGNEAILNESTLTAMITQAEPKGARPERQHAMLFIVVKHYLAGGNHLMVLSRSEPAQPPVLLRNDCLPVPPGTSSVRGPLNELTSAQKQTLIRYLDLIGPVGTQTASQGAAMGQSMSNKMDRREPALAAVDGFSIDVYEVTNAQYRQFIEAQGYQTQTHWAEPGWTWVQGRGRAHPSYWENDQLNQPDQPVVGVSWYEADAFCRWAGKSLPTDEQWVKSCQGDDGRKYPWGDSLDATDAPAGGANMGEVMTVAVGSAPQTQSPYGVHDLAGSALEWTATERETGGFMLRGGSGASPSKHVGCEVSHNLLPTVAANFIGFRCQSTQ